MKLLFLDVDGVLNCITTKDQCGIYMGIEDAKVKILKEIIDETGATIVLSSDWKYGWHKETANKVFQEETANYLDNKLKKQNLKIVDRTYEYYVSERGKGIKEFLNLMKRKNVEVENFVILDDRIFDFEKEGLLEHFVHTDFKTGLNEERKKKAIEILNKTKREDN